MSSNATSLSNLRRLGYRSVQRQPLDRFKSSSQDLLNENNIKSRLEEELNWFEGSRPAKSIENLLSPSENERSRPTKSRIPAHGNVDEKKKKLMSQGLFRDSTQLHQNSGNSGQSRLPKPNSILSQEEDNDFFSRGTIKIIVSFQKSRSEESHVDTVKRDIFLKT